MISKIVKKLRSLTMKSQIILFNVFTLMIVLSIVWIPIINLFNFYCMFKQKFFHKYPLVHQIIYKENKIKITLLQEQDKDGIGFIAQHIAITIELKFMSILTQMEQIKRFYIFFEQEKENIFNNQKQDPCIQSIISNYLYQFKIL